MIYQLCDLFASALSGSNSGERVERVVVYILEIGKKTNSENTMSTKEIKNAYKVLKSKHPNIIDIPENTIATKISILASTPSSRIQCSGKKQGYFITIAPSSPDIDDNSDTIKDGKLLEKDLYPAIVEWMNVSLGVNSYDISSKRTKDKWKNPDLLGIKEIDFLGHAQFEITTVEVKPSMTDWTMYIFEAVSHSLFSNRTYFAYLKDNSDEKVPDEMKLYASQFGIGIITITIDDKERPNIKDASALIKAIGKRKCEIKEEVPAPYHTPDINLQKKFLDGLSISTESDLRNFK